MALSAPENPSSKPTTTPLEGHFGCCAEKSITFFVLALLGTVLVATGLYLMIGSTGTISARLIGFAYLLGGTAFFAFSAMKFIQSFK